MSISLLKPELLGLEIRYMIGCKESETGREKTEQQLGTDGTGCDPNKRAWGETATGPVCGPCSAMSRRTMCCHSLVL